MSIVTTLAEMTTRWNVEDAAELVAERNALRARLDSLYGAELLCRALAEAEVLVSGYVRLHGRVWHISEINRLAQAAIEHEEET